tara:strand:+ start:756 stop:1769 length:1014 start_codon:yes stop_codon:yes gene_type:complete
MSFQIGDKVSFLNEALDGVISKIIDHKLVEVTTSDGFGIPVLIAELVKIGKGAKNKSNPILSNNRSDTNNAHIPMRSSIDVKPYLCFSRHLEKGNELYVLNNTPYVHFFALRIQKAGEWILIYSGKVSKRSYVFVGNYIDKELEIFRNVSIDIINIEFSLKKRFPLSSALVKIKPSKFFKESSYTEIPVLEKNAMLVDISGEIIKPIEPKEELIKSVQSIPKRKPLESLKIIGKIDLKQDKKSRSRGEFDLHIEQLGVPFKGKSNGEIVQIQLDKARGFIDQSILAGKREIILVHGVGNGVLKKEVHKLLRSYYGISFEQADARNYGEGATLVHLKG